MHENKTEALTTITRNISVDALTSSGLEYPVSGDALNIMNVADMVTMPEKGLNMIAQRATRRTQNV